MSKLIASLMLLLLATCCMGQVTNTVYLTTVHQDNVERYRVVLVPEPNYQESDERFQRTTPNLTNRAYVGKQDDEPDLKNTFRMINTFDLGGIPQNAEIVSAKLIVTLTLTSNQSNPSYEFEVFSSPSNILQLSAESQWNVIDQATKILDMGTFPGTQYARDYEVGVYYRGHTFANYIEGSFGGLCHMALKSVDESWGAGYPTVHVMDFKNNVQPSIGPQHSFKLEVEYRTDFDVSFVNDGNFQGPSWDFLIDGVQRAHGYSTLWQLGTEHDIEMNSHSQIPYSTDNNRPYDREPKEWSRTGGSSYPGSIWADITVQGNTDFTARHHRVVENQFLTLLAANGTDLDVIPFDIAGQASISGDIKSSHHGDQSAYIVTLPFSHLDQASGRTYFMVNWNPDTYGTWGGTTNTVTQSISPDLHHKLMYGNPRIAEYQNFMFRSIDSDDEIASIVPTNITVNNTTKVMSFTIPLSVSVNGVEYVFYSWDDHSTSTIDYGNGTVSKTFVLGADDFNYAMAMAG